jgi:hypothetical protein
MLVTLGFGLAACSTGSAPASPEPAAPAASGDLDLSGVCNDTISIQLQWQPQSDMGALFQLLGDDYSTDSSQKSVTGSLIAGGEDTGVDLRLLSGGPAIGFQPVISQLYTDDSIDLGLVHSDEAIVASGDQPVIGVTPLLTYSPQILMWDPSTYGDDFSIKDIASTGAPVVVASTGLYPAWLVSKGFVTADQVDKSFDGAPARFVSDPSIFQQGFANSEPYTYENDTESWNKPIGYELLRDVGYNVYASNVSVRKDKLEEMTPCLEKLVPIIQQATVDYLASPEQTNQKIVDVVGSDDAYFPYTIGEADFSSKMLGDEGLIANENDTVGTYDMIRAQGFIDELAPIAEAEGAAVVPSLSAEDLFTDQFSDISIALP